MMFGVFALWIPFYLVNSDRRKEELYSLRDCPKIINSQCEAPTTRRG